MIANNGRIFLNTNKFNNRVLNLQVGESLKNYINAVALMKGVKVSILLLAVLREIFGKEEKDFADRVSEVRKKEGLSTEGWSRRYLPEHLRPEKDEFCSLPIEDRIKFLTFSDGIMSKPTWVYNAHRFVFNNGNSNLAWSLNFDASLRAAKIFIEENQPISAVAP